MNLSSILSLVESYYADAGYATVFVASILEGTPLAFITPASVLVALGGFYAKSAELSLIGIILAGWIGTWLAFILAYLTGRDERTFFIKVFKQEKQMKQAHKLFDRYGMFILTTSYITPFIRFWISYIAGSNRYSLKRFTAITGVTSLAWTSFVVIVGYLFGSERQQIENIFSRLGILGIPVLLVILVFVGFKVKSELDKINKNEDPGN